MKKKFYIFSFVALALLVVYFAYPYLLENMASSLIVRDQLRPADVIVVLGGDDNGERVAAAVALYQQGLAPKLLMTGGPLAWKLTCAEWMKKQARSLGVPASAILTEDRSESTIENAQLSLPILKANKVKRLILVTSPLHSWRAKRVFKKVLAAEPIEIISSPVKLQDSKFTLANWWSRHEDTQLVMWEYVSRLYYFLKGY